MYFRKKFTLEEIEAAINAARDLRYNELHREPGAQRRTGRAALVSLLRREGTDFDDPKPYRQADALIRELYKMMRLDLTV